VDESIKVDLKKGAIMKKGDVEELLNTMKPKRSLSTHFTERTLSKVAPSSGRPLLLQPLYWMRRSPAFIAIAIVMFLSGGVYAATHWPEITAKFGSKTELPSGNKIIGVDTTNCNYFQVQNRQAPTNEKIYYEINKDSSLTDDQVVSMVQGICEENAVNKVVGQAIRPFAEDARDNIMTGNNFRLDSLTNTTVTVTNDIKDYGPDTPHQEPYQVTYPLAKNLKVYDGNQTINYSDLKSGDTLTLVVKNDQPISKASLTAKSNPWVDSHLITVLAIIRTPHFKGSPMIFYTHLGFDFVRTEPCNYNPTGFCRAYEFIKHQAGLAPK
jgi:hypothetical protein